MLLRVVALLGLGVLCSSAPPRATRPPPPQEEPSRVLVGLIIREVLQDVKKLNLSAAPSLVTVSAKVERCTRSHLKTFASTLAALNTPSKLIARKLSLVNTYKNTLPEDLDQDCETVQVTSDEFLETLDRFLRLLSEKIQNA